VAEGLAPGFGGLLRQLRTGAGLTQEELAEAASLSPRSVSDLERGINLTARKETARLLADALGLAGAERALFVTAARGRAPALAAGEGVLGSAAAPRTLPRDIASFTGRDAELDQLMNGLADAAVGGAVVGICAIGGMAGIGKTTLAVHAAYQLAEHFPGGQVFVPLHAHTPGQRPVDPADALASLLLMAGLAARAIPPGLDARAACWRDYLAGKKMLLVLDDAAGHEQVRPLLPGAGGCLVLITSRRRLAALEDAAVISLDALPPDEAAALLARLARRPGLGPADAGVGEITRLCGYLPLAIGMLARQLHHHPAWTTAGLAKELATARDRLELMHAENLSVAAAFGLSYRDLTAGRRRLFRRLGLQPGPDIDTYAAAALAGTSLATARRHLQALYDQHLIGEPAPGRYRLHDLLREHARALAAADDPAAPAAATGRLLDYYLHTALAASKHIPAQNYPSRALPAAQLPDYGPPMSTAGQASAWLETERANLHAATGYALAHDRPQPAMLIPAAMADFLWTRGYWDQALGLHQSAVAAARQAGDRAGEARALILLGPMQVMTNDLAGATATFQHALALYRDLGDRAGQGEAISGIGFVHGQTGNFAAAAASQRQALEVFRDVGDRRGQADALNELGTVSWLTGDYPAAAAHIEQALGLFRDLSHRHGEGEALINLGAVQKLTGDYPAATATLRQAQVLYRELGDRYSQAWVRNELGVLQRLTGDYPAAAASNQQALGQFRDLAEPGGQAAALDGLGLVQQLTGDYPAAAASHDQALRLFRDLGDRYGQAEVLNSLGELSSRIAASQQARNHHSHALAIARDIGSPLEEARALEGIGRSHLHHGHTPEGTAHLQQALTIYQRIGAPAAQRLQQTLHSHRAKNERPAPAPER
jgi:tetratricopeptide (TPR) repeat protein/transcriptional regulator with XRE-family HTH domain